MGEKHELVVLETITKWTVERKGRLYKMMQGTFRNLHNDGCTTISPYPQKKQSGFPDIFGFTNIKITPEMVGQTLPIYTLCEVKTIAYPTLTKEQKAHLNYCVSIGGRAYVALEDSSPEGYKLTEWVPC